MLVREQAIKKFIKGFIFFVFVALFLGSCQTAPEVVKKKEPKVALVLGGGSAKGFAHVGVIRVLEQEKIPIHLIVGTSVGSLIGGLYAANPDSFQLEYTAFTVDKSDIIDMLVVPKLGLGQGARLEAFLEKNIKVKRVEDTKIPFYPIATDLNTGETMILEKGSIVKAIRASSAIPGVFVPVNYDNRLLVDGGVSNNIACDVAKNIKGADIVIAVNLQKDIRNYDIKSVVDVMGQSINIMMHETNKSKLRYADVIIEPDIRDVSLFDFTKKKQLMESGIKATREAIPKIKELLARYQ
ncbi:MAG TPA: patatin-like phospholipase family protein [Syntrophorhabdaceae bacterium]|nr:patatin-like phospholipase family protein [Syntrophorhabdaceae bacterium]HOL04720.1 patatin-like phospholipase family protein [Syntrophorhabdaceae bacterium]HON85273.1 patatin-like phospholipase family protein [Syntrophorhabdaceae bacterium]HOT42588.1 patatin-like phospholipase family protein [Syntrophorhabdaceae bacterium]HPC66154.1 patatin-like phospholipase family protein [Syntrophorhabdaceae bacterium]